MHEWWQNTFEGMLIQDHKSLPDFEETSEKEIKWLAEQAFEWMGSDLEDTTFENVCSFITETSKQISGTLTQDLHKAVYQFDVRCQIILGLVRLLTERIEQGHSLLRSGDEYLLVMSDFLPDEDDEIPTHITDILDEGNVIVIGQYDDSRFVREFQSNNDFRTYSRFHEETWNRIERASKTNNLHDILAEVGFILEEITDSNISTAPIHLLAIQFCKVSAVEDYISNILY